MGKNKAPVAKGKPGGNKGALNKKEQRPSMTKDASKNFLKQRGATKVKEIRARLKGRDDDDDDMDSDNEGMTDVQLDSRIEKNSMRKPSSLMDIINQAQKRTSDFEAAEVAAEAALDDDGFGFEGGNREREAENTRRKFKVELKKVLASADIIIEVLDARDPESCRSVELEKQVTGQGKRLILLMNKIDLVPKHIVEAWRKHLSRSFPTLVFKAAHGGAKRVIHANTSAMNAPEGLLQSTHAVVGADEVMQLLKNYARMKDGTKSHVTVGVVGYPNTGKSSLINSMKRHCAVETGGKAGVTKVMQEVQLDSKVTLVDCPGIVFEGTGSDPSLVLRNVVRVENVTDPGAVVAAMLEKAPSEAVASFYGLPENTKITNLSQVQEFIAHVAQQRGKLRRGSALDMDSAAKSIISDWTTGKFRYYANPPADSAKEDAAAAAESIELVTTMSAAFDIDALFNGRGAKPAVLGAPNQRGGGGVDCDMDML
mmetsp:Transcript_43312/g.92720  ORF Transcript_43312/g.92720 Transcript_43312/m.92720 type:complete len:484 (+) Transcript_43312:150-1601(+)|eukprot:CAMPEP_0206439716 /NCGR_PEP_ID=MMETSP0324_2-20121206/12369_1 /ASSEMBLY_ACC=CAM_ASM_000836 /TAXON_ID=2866 /ORGANISM="Crypthecodinium cohnii, Strain Seligo" /LENGTH=483 /DNA_ID=CAMNT_0053907375 /DNA_START=129 /DNA_END=1580 /DNA_ORIENTATION=+